MMIRPTPPAADRSVAGFTLVELLVVIGIIALLISILLPTLNSVRRQARGVACLSNIRQVSLGNALYVNTWDGWFPQFLAEWPDWPSGLYYQVWVKTNDEIYGNASETGFWRPAEHGNAEAGVWVCPDYNSTFHRENRAARSFSFNAVLSGNYVHPNGPFVGNKVTKVENQSDVAVWFEANADNIIGANNVQTLALYSHGERPSGRGTDGLADDPRSYMNVAFSDGSGRPITFKEALTPEMLNDGGRLRVTDLTP